MRVWWTYLPLSSQLSDSFSFLWIERKAFPLGYSPKNMRTTISSEDIITSNWILWHGDVPLAWKLEQPLFFSFNTTKKFSVSSPLTNFRPHTVEALLNSCNTQHFSFSHLTSYEVLLLTVSHITLLYCNNYSSALHHWASPLWLLNTNLPPSDSSLWSTGNSPG